MNRNLLIGVLAAAATALIGSSWQLISRHGVSTTLGPAELATLRYGVPALVLLPLLLRTRGDWPAAFTRRRFALLVLGGGLPFGLLVMAGAQWAPAAHIGVFVTGSMPLFTAFGAWRALGEPVSGLRLAGLALIFAGLAWFGAASLGGASGVPGAWRGDVLFLLASMFWAGYTLVFRRSGLTAWQGAAAVSAGSAVLLLPMLLWVGAPRLLTAPWTDVALQALGQGVLGGLLGIVTYSIAITRLGAARASLSGAPVPLLTGLGGAWLLGEPLAGATGLAMGLTFAGMALAAGVGPRLGRR